MESRNARFIRKLYLKFKVAFEGLKEGMTSDFSIQLQMMFSVLAIIIAFIFRFNEIEWAIWLICIGLVVTLEFLNSAFEQMLDRFDPSYHALTKRAKDLGAAAVLVSALISLMIGFLFMFKHL